VSGARPFDIIQIKREAAVSIAPSGDNPAGAAVDDLVSAIGQVAEIACSALAAAYDARLLWASVIITIIGLLLQR
jgi:hypothetical protein